MLNTTVLAQVVGRSWHETKGWVHSTSGTYQQQTVYYMPDMMFYKQGLVFTSAD
jgi:hypothetical protein